MSTAKQEEIVRKFIDAYNAFDVDSMLAVLHPDIRFRNVSGGEISAEAVGKPGFEKLARHSASLFRSRFQSVRSLRAHGEKVTVEIDFQAVLAEDLPDGPRAGDAISVRGRSEYVFKDGLIESIVDES